MKNWWRWIGLMTAWWMVVFLVQRILFEVFAFRALREAGWTEILASHWHAIPMDLSATGYILLVTSLFATPLLFRDVPWIRRSLGVWSMLLLAATALLNVVDSGLFTAWGSKLDRKALSYLAFPKEAMAGVPLHQALMLLGLAIAQTILLGLLLRTVHRDRNYTTAPKGTRVATAVLTPLLCLLAARGGPQDDPINKSWAYFSRHSALNLAALNSVWNALEIAVAPAQIESNPYVTMPREEAERTFEGLHPERSGTTRSILKAEKPNVLLVLLESWTADIIEPLGGDSGVAPNFTGIAREGLLFDHFYSTGFRTEQGLCALISAFPAQPKTTIIRNFGKFDRLPSVVRQLGHAGYSSTYWYAGNVEFANTRAYLEAMGFDHVHDEQSFPIQRRTEWGAFDEELFSFYLQESSKDRPPFFHVLMTATSHEPFDAPVDEGFTGGSDPQLYRNVVHYTDRCLGDLLDQAKQQPWYANTLIIIAADHGHYLPRYLDQRSAARHRIPFVITGGALRDDLRGTINATYGCHVDFPATLLGQLGMDHSGFPWSHDLFDPSVPHRAFWTFNEGFGTADSVQTLVLDPVGGHIIEVRDSSRTSDTQRLLHEGRAQLQILLEQYLGYDQ